MGLRKYEFCSEHIMKKKIATYLLLSAGLFVHFSLLSMAENMQGVPVQIEQIAPMEMVDEPAKAAQVATRTVGKLKINKDFASPLNRALQNKSNVYKGNLYGPHGADLQRLAATKKLFIAIRDTSVFAAEGIVDGGAGKDFHVKFKSSTLDVQGLRGRIPIWNRYSKKKNQADDVKIVNTVLSQKDDPKMPYTSSVPVIYMGGDQCQLHDKMNKSDDKDDSFIGNLDPAQLKKYFVYRCKSQQGEVWRDYKGKLLNNLTSGMMEELEKSLPVEVLAFKQKVSLVSSGKLLHSLKAAGLLEKSDDAVRQLIPGQLLVSVATGPVVPAQAGSDIQLTRVAAYTKFNNQYCRVFENGTAMEDTILERPYFLKCGDVWYEGSTKARIENKGILDSLNSSESKSIDVAAEVKPIIPDYDTAAVRSQGYDFEKRSDEEHGFVNDEDEAALAYLKAVTDDMVLHGSDANNPVGFLFEMTDNTPYTIFAPRLDNEPGAQVYSCKNVQDYLDVVNQYRAVGYNVLLNPRTGVELVNQNGRMVYVFKENKNQRIDFEALEAAAKQLNAVDKEKVLNFFTHLYRFQQLLAMVSFDVPVLKKEGHETSCPNNVVCTKEGIHQYHSEHLTKAGKAVLHEQVVVLSILNNKTGMQSEIEKLIPYLQNLKQLYEKA